MKLGQVLGKVWATVKDPRLEGINLAILQPIDEHKKPLGSPLIAANVINAREKDIVFWVGSAEACTPFADRMIPSDATIVGYVDRIDI